MLIFGIHSGNIMKKLQALFFLGWFIILSSCQLATEEPKDFKLLPLPQQYEIKGTSTLKYDDILHFYTSPDINLPVRDALLENIEWILNQSNWLERELKRFSW